MKKGLFITFEGKDGSGKSTQAMHLAQELIKAGFKVKYEHFPRYDCTIGGLIGDVLAGRKDMPNSFEALQMLYVADQKDFQEDLKGALEAGYIVIADRYDLSTVAYYSSKKNIPVQLGYMYINSLQDGFIEPDVTFIIKSSDEDLDKRRSSINKQSDIIERDKKITSTINTNYIELYKLIKNTDTFNYTRNVYCINGDDDIDMNKQRIQNIIDEILEAGDYD